MPTIDSNLDQATLIPELTVNTLQDISFERMLAILTPFVLVQVPEDTTTVDEQRRLDYLLARCVNLHAYLRVLWSQATYLRAQFRGKDPEQAELMQKKKEVLYELGNAMKLKYEAASRKVTVLLEDEGDDKVSDAVNYDARRAARDDRSESRPTTKSPYDASRKGAGWGVVT